LVSLYPFPHKKKNDNTFRDNAVKKPNISCCLSEVLAEVNHFWCADNHTIDSCYSKKFKGKGPDRWSSSTSCDKA